jgi:hypothetical protein
MKEPKVIDAFPGFNEVQLAKFRIEYLASWVDRTVIAESSLTHSGKPKPLYFSEWLETCEAWVKEKVEIVLIPLSPDDTSWGREIATRELLAKFLIDKYPDDLFILSDLDEIPSSDQIIELKKSSGVYHFKTPTSYRKSNWQLTDVHMDWKLGVMGQVSHLCKLSNGGRFEKLALLESAPGAHLSYFGVDSILISEKYSALAHTELDKEFWKSLDLLGFCDRFRIDHLGRSRNPGFGVFRIVAKGENAVIDSISKRFPQHYDAKEELPNILLRIYASIYISSYVRDSYISRMKRKVINPKIYFHSKLRLWLFLPALEIFFTLLSFLIYRIKYRSKSLKRESTK